MRFPYHGAGVLLVCRSEDGYKILLGKRSKPLFKNRFSIPGGGREPGESEIETAVRELREETGLELGKISKAKLGEWHLYLPFFTWRTFFYLTESMPNGVPSEFYFLDWFEISKIKGLKTRPFTNCEISRLEKLLRH